MGRLVAYSIAMKHVDASHGAVVLGLLPIFTACFGSIVSKEQLPALFWAATIIGTLIVVGFLLFQAHGVFKLYDLMLVGGVISAAIGYAMGAELSKKIGSWRVISWALLLTAPFLIIPVTMEISATGFHPGSASLWGFLYVSFVSMFLAFFAWYKGLAMGGTSKIGLLQLLQPFVTIFASTTLLNEKVSVLTIVVASLVAALVFIGQKARA